MIEKFDCIDLNYRTTSEGNHFGNIASFKTRGKSITSGSPMSPGSYISSESAVESAGSSNSIDDTEIGYGMLLRGTFNTKWAYIKKS